MDRLLFIERASVLRLRLTRLLQEAGYEDVLAYQERSVPFDRYYKAHGPFSMVLIDSDAFPEELDLFLKSINEQTKERSSKVILFTANGDSKNIISLFRKGADDVILKPFNDATIVKKLRLRELPEMDDVLALYKNAIKSSDTRLVWCSDYQIGVPEIDGEHRDIIDHFTKLYELMKVGQANDYCGELLEFLEYYVVHHFDHEEALMQQHGYPEYEGHSELHKEFKAHVKRMLGEYSSSDVKPIDLIKLNLFIKGWLSQHILIEDKKIGAYLKSNPNN